MLLRLQKYIADQGLASRRRAERLIGEGKVKVNDKIITKLGTKVDPTKDKIEVQSQKSALPENNQKVYIILNKPIDYISSASHAQGKSVLDLINNHNYLGRSKLAVNARLYPVGRLDKDSEGLILLTNDGALANRLTHPRYEHEKEYEVVIDRPLTRDAKFILTKGMSVADENYQGIKINREFNKGRKTIVTIILKEGKNRQIRKMFGALGYNIITLRRTRLGKLKLGVLPVGKWRLAKLSDII